MGRRPNKTIDADVDPKLRGSVAHNALHKSWWKTADGSAWTTKPGEIWAI